MELPPHYSLSVPLVLPIRVRTIDDLPKVFAGSIPLTPINLVLRQRCDSEGATLASLKTYVRAARLYAEFCAHRHRGLLDISDEEFTWFKRALLGEPFPDTEGRFVHLSGRRQKRTADLMLTLLYSLAADIAERYEVSFVWRRYKGFSLPPSSSRAGGSARSYFPPHRRAHRIKWVPRKIVGLPDDQFARLLQVAHARWGDQIADGDLAFAHDPETQRGALFYRNVAILMVLRYAGSRRSEVVQVRFADIDRVHALIHLETKGHRGGGKRRLPVILFDQVQAFIWLYATRYRALRMELSEEEQQLVFVSHSVRDYGHPISDESVRALIDTLRTELDAPWNSRLTPHMLRHSFGYDLQRFGGPAAVIANMRHASSRSSEPYAAGPDILADALLEPATAKIAHLLAQAGLSEVFHHEPPLG